MLGLIFDNILVFLFRVTRKLYCERITRNWLTTTGVVEQKEAYGGSYPYASVSYWYSVNGERYPGTYTKPFWSQDGAYNFIRRVAQPSAIVVRYNPANPAESFIREPENRELRTPAQA